MVHCSVKHIAQALLRWYRENARDLPWRRTTDPYAIWIAEVMLQQTQVKTVIPYWERWMVALPNIGALAKARIDRVLKLWEGLGYYSRARNLQRAAQIIIEEFGSSFPRDFEDVIELPGIGRYTAGAICSIAFDQPRPVLDGNVIRVLTRLYAITGNPKEPETNKRLWNLAEGLVAIADKMRINGERPCSDLNQALMELGATICTPTRPPQCAECPIRRDCVAFVRNIVDRLPISEKRVRSTPRRFVAVVLRQRGKFLVRKRPPQVVNAGLWEFPNLEIRNGMGTEAALREMARDAEVTRVSRIKHTITRYRMTVDVFEAKIETEQNCPDGRWCSKAELERLAFSSAHRRIANEFLQKPAKRAKVRKGGSVRSCGRALC